MFVIICKNLISTVYYYNNDNNYVAGSKKYPSTFGFGSISKAILFNNKKYAEEFLITVKISPKTTNEDWRNHYIFEIIKI